MIGRCIIQWLLTFSLCLGAGWVMGTVLDAVLFELSFDYVFPPQYCTQRGLAMGAVAASLMSMGHDWLRSEQLPWRVWLWNWRGAICLPMCPLFIAVAAAGLVKLGMTTGHSTLAPPARQAFCNGLVYGAVAGTGVSVALILLLCRRSCLKHQEHNATLLTQPPGIRDSGVST